MNGVVDIDEEVNSKSYNLVMESYDSKTFSGNTNNSPRSVITLYYITVLRINL